MFHSVMCDFTGTHVLRAYIQRERKRQRGRDGCKRIFRALKRCQNSLREISIIGCTAYNTWDEENTARQKDKVLQFFRVILITYVS